MGRFGAGTGGRHVLSQNGLSERELYPGATGFSGIKLQGAESATTNRTHPALRAPLRGGDHDSRLPLGKVPLPGGVAESRGGSNVEPVSAVSDES